jgi:hypothetical protein
LIACAGAADAAPWLFVTDIHLKSNYLHAAPSRLGDDTDRALFDTALREMQRVDPHPPVVVITGDLLAHLIDRRTTLATSELIARQFDRAFPDAQFVLALGNNDGSCGDYGLTPDSPFLRDAAKAWEPLVNRHGAAPDFMRTFVHDGFYVAKLPVPGLRAIVLNDVYWSPRYHSGCGPAGDAAGHMVNELDSALRATSGRAWVLMHIPPGVDPFTTFKIAHRLAIVPFLDPSMRDALTSLLTRTPGQVALAVAGHTHKFGFRIVDAESAHPVPMLMVPALSPIFANAPAFLTAGVANDGVPYDVRVTSYIDHKWVQFGGLRELGVDAFTGPQLVALQSRLDRDQKLRAAYARLYTTGGYPEIDDRDWSVYWCSATAFTTAAFRACDKSGGVSLFTNRGVFAALAIVVPFFIIIAGVIVWRVRRRRLRA